MLGLSRHPQLLPLILLIHRLCVGRWPCRRGRRRWLSHLIRHRLFNCFAYLFLQSPLLIRHLDHILHFRLHLFSLPPIRAHPHPSFSLASSAMAAVDRCITFCPLSRRAATATAAETLLVPPAPPSPEPPVFPPIPPSPISWS